jgi:hypothetical protein
LTVLLFKIILAPVLIGLVSLAGRRWGPGVSGWLLGLPLNSAPIFLFLLMEQGPGFAARAAVGTLLGILAWAAFTLVYAYCCLRLPWWWSTIAGWLAFSALAWLLIPVNAGVIWVFLLVCATLAVVLLLFPRVEAPASPSFHSNSELWLRMAIAGAMVTSLTTLAKVLGPGASGVLSAFPASVRTSSLAWTSMAFEFQTRFPEDVHSFSACVWTRRNAAKDIRFSLSV